MHYVTDRPFKQTSTVTVRYSGREIHRRTDTNLQGGRGGGGLTKICLTETGSARFLLSYKIDLVSVHKGLERFLYNMVYYKSICMFLWLFTRATCGSASLGFGSVFLSNVESHDLDIAITSSRQDFAFYIQMHVCVSQHCLRSTLYVYFTVYLHVRRLDNIIIEWEAFVACICRALPCVGRCFRLQDNQKQFPLSTDDERNFQRVRGHTPRSF